MSSREQAKQWVLEMYEEIISPDSMTEGTYELIEKYLLEHPDLADIFIGKFEAETDRDKKEALAMIILSVRSYPPAEDFLRAEFGWTDDDFQDYRWYE